jgi:ZIP family zinc transporter
LAVGVLWWSRSWDSRSFYCWGCNIGWIGIQNFPEGIAVSMPLRRMSRWKSFMYGQSSALVEPIAAVWGFCSYVFTPILPYAFFAAGAMIFVVVEE